MRKTNKGFTLVELIIVIAILAIIMLIAIPNFSGIQQRMKVRADKATAAQIAKAVRVWYTDYTSGDTTLSLDDTEDCPDDVFVKASKCTDYRGLSGITAYTADTYFPSSLLNGSGAPEELQCYVVGLTDDDVSKGKICVGIVKGTEDEDEDGNKIVVADASLSIGTSVSYDGTAAAIAYVEP